jgi:hypothetical protein
MNAPQRDATPKDEARAIATMADAHEIALKLMAMPNAPSDKFTIIAAVAGQLLTGFADPSRRAACAAEIANQAMQFADMLDAKVAG